MKLLVNMHNSTIVILIARHFGGVVTAMYDQTAVKRQPPSKPMGIDGINNHFTSVIKLNHN